MKSILRRWKRRLIRTDLAVFVVGFITGLLKISPKLSIIPILSHITQKIISIHPQNINPTTTHIPSNTFIYPPYHIPSYVIQTATHHHILINILPHKRTQLFRILHRRRNLNRSRPIHIVVALPIE